MRLIQKILCALALAGISLVAAASPADPKNGAEYFTLPTAQNTDTGKKIEVIEFFAYSCPHCFVFEPVLSAWVKKQGENIVFKRIHVPREQAHQRLFLTLEAMGQVDKLQAKVFDAIHVQHQDLRRDEEVFEWAAKQGIDKTRFSDTYRSFGIQAKQRRAAAMMTAYRIDQWPMIAIDGRFMTSPSHVGEANPAMKHENEMHAGVLTVMDHLVAKAKAEKN